jgi:hypothetical protein
MAGPAAFCHADAVDRATLRPERVLRATEQAARAGFTMSCAPDTGRLIAVLAAAVPPGQD